MMKKENRDIFIMCLIAGYTVLGLAALTKSFIMYLISFISFLGLTVWWLYSIFTYNPEDEENKKEDY